MVLFAFVRTSFRFCLLDIGDGTALCACCPIAWPQPLAIEVDPEPANELD
ncbi:MAG: hypothetical protein KDJ45_12865 [Hyphomicrobiaceae bacterium]|nr:hypothetical protein [Hyphomicrobiaceae bacterium]MCC0011130.1 hypothetical protein [Hyphomicrobiaceae bacterium]